MKRPTQLTYGLKPHHKAQSETSVQPCKTSVQSSKKPRQIDKNVLKSGHTGAGSVSGEEGYASTSQHNNDKTDNRR